MLIDSGRDLLGPPHTKPLIHSLSKTTGGGKGEWASTVAVEQQNRKDARMLAIVPIVIEQIEGKDEIPVWNIEVDEKVRPPFVEGMQKAIEEAFLPVEALSAVEGPKAGQVGEVPDISETKRDASGNPSVSKADRQTLFGEALATRQGEGQAATRSGDAPGLCRAWISPEGDRGLLVLPLHHRQQSD